VDTTVETNLAERYDIQGYPTLKFFIDGEPIEYTGLRSEFEIIVWIDKKTGPILKEVQIVEELENVINGNEVVVVLFSDLKDSEAVTVFKRVAYRFEEVVFVLAQSETLRAHYKVETVNNVVLFKKFDEGRNDCNCEINEDSLKNFVEINQFPTVMVYNEKSAKRIFGEGITTFFLFLGKEQEDSKGAKDALVVASEKLKGKIAMCISYFSNDLGQGLAEYFGLTEQEVPKVKFFFLLYILN